MKEVIRRLKKHKKIIVTGPPRSGTTIASLILSDMLNYKFVDESMYDGNNVKKFSIILNSPRKIVIQNTAFTRDLHNISNILNNNNIAVVLVKRNINSILESFENTNKFKKSNIKNGLFEVMDEEAKSIILNHYGYKNGCIPQIIYNHLYKHKNLFKYFYEINYDDLKFHKLFIKKEVRRKKFTHIKQVKENEPDYIYSRKGIMVW